MQKNNFQARAEYERLARECDRACRFTRLTTEREFYTYHAVLFRRLADARRTRDEKVVRQTPGPESKEAHMKESNIEVLEEIHQQLLDHDVVMARPN